MNTTDPHITDIVTVRLTRGQQTDLRHLINDKRDALFDRLRMQAELKAEARVEALRESLRFWDAVDTAIRDAQSCAVPAVSADGAGDGYLYHEDNAAALYLRNKAQGITPSS